MTIDEFIEHSIEVAEENRINANNIESNMYIPLSVDKDNLIDNCIKCAEEHEQLVRWLEELKAYKDEKEYWDMQNHKAYEQGRQDLIDKINNLKNQYVDACNMCTNEECDACANGNLIVDLEMLKESKE